MVIGACFSREKMRPITRDSFPHLTACLLDRFRCRPSSNVPVLGNNTNVGEHERMKFIRLIVDHKV